MNILETLVKLRDDLKTWTTNNLVALNSKIENLDYTDLNNQPNILDDNSDKFTVTDSEGNIILQVDENGLSTTSLTANGENVIDKINTHKDNELIHITQAEREAWEAKSNFDGDYNNLINKPNLLDDNSDSFVIADSEGNIAMKVDSEGLSATKVHAEAIDLNGKEFTGDYNELENKPNITEDTNGNLIVADENGNIMMKVDERGLSTTNISANSINFNGQEFSGDYNELENKPNLLDDNSDSFTVADKDGNIIVKIDGDGLKTTAVSVNGADVAESLAANSEALGKHENNTIMHVTAAEKTEWNNKSDFDGNYNNLINKPNLLDDNSDSFIVADSEGNVILDVDVEGLKTTAISINGEDVATKIQSVSDALGAHIDDDMAHITPEERATWNAKSDFDGNYNNLTNKPNLLDDESDNFVVADNAGNIIAKIDKDGLETTKITTTEVVINGTDVISYVDTKVASVVDAAPETLDTLNELAAALGDDPNFATTVLTQIGKKTDKTYVDTELDKKADKVHTHEQYLEASDIVSKADKTYVDEKIAEAKADASSKDANILLEAQNGISSVQTNLTNHTGNTNIHITPEERATWNAKSDFSGKYNELIDAPNIQEDESGEVVYTDEDGNIIAKIGENGLETTGIIAKSVTVNGMAIDNALFFTEQDLTDEQKAQARKNIGVVNQYYVTPQMFGAVANGVTDDTEAFMKAAAYCATNKKTFYVPEGKYLTNENCVIANVMNIEIDGYVTNLTLRDNASIGLSKKVRVFRCDNLTLRDYINSYFQLGRITNLTIYANTDDVTSSAFAYNYVVGGQATNFTLEAFGNGWINENTFERIRTTNLTINKANDNKFYDVCLENSTINILRGHHNYINYRGEGECTVNLNEELSDIGNPLSFNNVIEKTYNSVPEAFIYSMDTYSSSYGNIIRHVDSTRRQEKSVKRYDIYNMPFNDNSDFANKLVYTPAWLYYGNGIVLEPKDDIIVRAIGDQIKFEVSLLDENFDTIDPRTIENAWSIKSVKMTFLEERLCYTNPVYLDDVAASVHKTDAFKYVKLRIRAGNVGEFTSGAEIFIRSMRPARIIDLDDGLVRSATMPTTTDGVDSGFKVYNSNTDSDILGWEYTGTEWKEFSSSKASNIQIITWEADD